MTAVVQRSPDLVNHATLVGKNAMERGDFIELHGGWSGIGAHWNRNRFVCFFNHFYLFVTNGGVKLCVFK